VSSPLYINSFFFGLSSIIFNPIYCLIYIYKTSPFMHLLFFDLCSIKCQSYTSM
jgi:hypothetical protein